MPYTSGIGFRSWQADHPSFKRLGAGTPSRFALVFTSAIERVPKQNRPILSRACPRVSERILAKKRVSEFPNIPGHLGFDRISDGDIQSVSGCYRIQGYVSDRFAWSNNGETYRGVSVFMDASRVSSVYGASDAVQPSSLRCLVLVRAF